MNTEHHVRRTRTHTDQGAQPGLAARLSGLPRPAIGAHERQSKPCVNAVAYATKYRSERIWQGRQSHRARIRSAELHCCCGPVAGSPRIADHSAQALHLNISFTNMPGRRRSNARSSRHCHLFLMGPPSGSGERKLNFNPSGYIKATASSSQLGP